MGKNLDRGLEKKVEIQQNKDPVSKTPRMDKIKNDTRNKLNNNFKK